MPVPTKPCPRCEGRGRVLDTPRLVRLLRKALSLSLKEIGDMVGVSPQSVYNVEAGYQHGFAPDAEKRAETVFAEVEFHAK